MPWRRLLNALLLLGFCTAVGAVSFIYFRNRPRCVIEGPHVPVALSADGNRHLTTAFHKGVIGPPLRVWDTRTGRLLFTFLENREDIALDEDIVEEVDDDPVLAYDLFDRAIHVIDWRAGSEKIIRSGPIHVLDAQLSPGSAWLLAWDDDGRCVFEVATGKSVLELDAPGVFSADDKFLFFQKVGEADRTVWDLHAAKKIGALPAFEIVGVPDGGRVVLMSPADGEGSGEHLIQVWELPTCVKRFERKYRSEGWMPPFSSPNGGALALVSHPLLGKRRLDILDVAAGGIVLERDCPAYEELDFSSDGAFFFLAESGEAAKLTVFETRSGRALWERQGRFDWMGFAADACVLVEEPRLEVVDARTGQTRLTMDQLTFAGSLTEPPVSRFLPMVVHEERQPAFWEAWLAEQWPEHFGLDMLRILVLDGVTGRVVCARRTPDVLGARLSLGGDVLMFARRRGDETFSIGFWDVYPGGAWLRASASVVAAAFGVWVLRRGWRRWRAGRLPP